MNTATASLLLSNSWRARWMICGLLLVFAGCEAGSRRAVPASGYRDWRMHGGGFDSIRYSALDEINRENVRQLEVAWTYDTGDAFQSSELQCNPIVIDGVLYATTPKLRLIALDAATGKLLWSFDPFEGGAPIGTVRNRGVAYWQDGQDRRIFLAEQHRLYAIDAGSGKPIPGFGNQGHIDLREGLGRDPRTLSVSAGTPGIVYKDLLIMGSVVSEGLPSARGDIRAYDVRTGAMRWTFHTIPHPGEVGYETWPEDAWQYIGGANSWAGLSLDVERGLVFVPTGSAAFDFYGSNRHGDNLFANSLLALRAETGERVWHFQAVKHDVWDRDFPASPNLISVLRDGRFVDAVAQVAKSGHVFVFERETGEPLFPIEYREYPASTVEGELVAKTQPLPLKPPPFSRQVLTEDMLTKRTPEAHQNVLERFRRVRSAGQFVPASVEGTIIFPGFDGGAEWGGAAFDPETGLLYVNANEMAWVMRLVERPPAGARLGGRDLYSRYCANCHKDDLTGTPPEFPSLVGIADRYSIREIKGVTFAGRGRMPAFAHMQPEEINAITEFVAFGKDTEVASSQRGSPIDLKYSSDGYNKFLDPDGYPAVEPPWGTLNAINLDSGEIAWKIPFGEFPELAAQGLPPTGTENYGGPVVTAGGLLFIGATNHDKKFRAFDKATGELLWEHALPAGGNATPAVFELRGRQYIVIAAGGGKSGAPSGGTYVAFALPEAATEKQ